MAARFVELAFSATPPGEVSPRRRHDPVLDAEVHEVLLGDEYLMSSAFPVAEQEPARLGLAPLASGPLLPTSAALLDDPRCALVAADFSAGLDDSSAWGADGPVHALLVDIDHSPHHLLRPGGVVRLRDGPHGDLPQPLHRGHVRQHGAVADRAG